MNRGKSRPKRARPGGTNKSIRGNPAKKSLGQNFLIDGNIARKIVGTVSAGHGDAVIEIGPGRGALTRLLAETGAAVIGIEKDRMLADELRKEFAPSASVEIKTDDFLEYELPETGGMFKVVGNIPYNLTSAIVSKLVDRRDRICIATLMVQDEVAVRLSAMPGTKQYGAISVRLQLVADVERLFVVGPTCFRPRPRVNSRVIRITFTEHKALSDENGFVIFIKRAFGMRRKMFRHFVASTYGKSSVDLLEASFRTRRVETFTPTELYEIFRTLERNIGHC